MAGLSRRSLIGAAALAALSAVPLLHRGSKIEPRLVDPAGATDWGRFKARFITREGRVVATDNGGISSSQGQGVALVAAACFDDAAGFARVESWTRRVLRRPTDHLHAWRYQPDTVDPISDYNNATEGDLLIALGLAMAEQRWGDREHGRAAEGIARDLLGLLVRRIGHRTLLLPGLNGFLFRDHAVVSPASYVFPALRTITRMAPDPAWDGVIEDGLALTRDARFGDWHLTPDWVAVPVEGGAVRPADGWAPRFSYAATRGALYMAWDGRVEEPTVAAAEHFWATAPGPPAWADLNGGDLAPTKQGAGADAVRQMIVAKSGVARAGHASDLPLPSIDDRINYYPASLILLSRIALAAESWNRT